MIFIFGSQHTLRNIPTTTRLCSGVPSAPPCTANGIMNNVISAVVSLKSGSISYLPHAHWSLKHLNHQPLEYSLDSRQPNSSTIATKNKRKSVYTTHKTTCNAKITVMIPAPTTVSQGSSPNIICPILMAAKVTPDIAITLKISPK